MQLSEPKICWTRCNASAYLIRSESLFLVKVHILVEIAVEAHIVLKAHLFWNYVSSEDPVPHRCISFLGAFYSRGLGLGSRIHTGRVQMALEFESHHPSRHAL